MSFVYFLILNQPAIVLYAVLALIYVVAAVASYAAGHRILAWCYATSSVVHGLLGATYYPHIG